jgi:poly-gamma-glutamate synthase PgsB/CapB
MSQAALRALEADIHRALPALDARLRQGSIAAVAERCLAEMGDGDKSALARIAALSRVMDAGVGEVDRLERQGSALLVAYQSALDAREKREILVRHLRENADGARELARDAVATRRWLDLEAVQERIAAQIADRLDELQVGYEFMRETARCGAADPGLASALLETGAVAAALRHAEPRRRGTLRVVALRFLQAVVGNVPPPERLAFLGVTSVRRVLGWAQGKGATRWTHVAALELCAAVLPRDERLRLLGEQLRIRSGGDHMVIRRNALRVLTEVPDADVLSLALTARDDPSEHVRQELARGLARLPGARSAAALARLARRDRSPRVAGVALRELAARALVDASARPEAAAATVACLGRVEEPTVVRVALESVERLATGPGACLSAQQLIEPLETLVNAEGTPAELVSAAATTLRALEAEKHPAIAALRERLQVAIDPLCEGEHVEVELPPDTAPRHLELALAAAARGDMTISLRRVGPSRCVVTRGEPRRWRAWRLLQELRTPMPDKRRGFVHSWGRVPAGEVVVPPSGMAEVTPTRVPGERQLCPAVGGWGPFLPRVDDLLTVATLRRRSLRLITPLGTVTIRGAERLRDRLRARAVLSLRYARFAQARERSLASTEATEQRRYAQLAAGLGFSMGIGDADGAVAGVPFRIRSELPSRYLSARLGVFLPIWLEPFASYVLSPTGNSPRHLALFAWIVFAGFCIRAALIKRAIVRARRAIPLSIGGWGTRGKSGSERLKAALFHALRYDVVVKTTGCEAMFIHAQRDLPAQEVFIYRPYDKATIWEQKKLLEVAQRLRAQVFLWECMALQPRFVDTLACDWMQDEITTLTNAYPDHEDIQGPTGEDVARVIARFMPKAGRTFTTEEQMLPLLRDAARKKETELVAIAPLEAELLPADLLARLPYQEHPRNVAMVLALAAHFGVDREFALVEIADHVILDLGVLKTYPSVTHRQRTLTFSNGMSANERAGFLSNWTRLGFDQEDVDAQEPVVTVAVVNNRADRVARSRVFAQILVDDASLDHVVLINSNLGGMMQFITEALDLKLRTMVVTGEGGAERALERFDAAMRWLKVPSRPGALRARVLRMLAALPGGDALARRVIDETELAAALDDGSPERIERCLEAAVQQLAAEVRRVDGREDVAADLVAHAVRLARRIAAARGARSEIAAALGRGAEDEANTIFRRAYRALFLDRIAVLWDAGASGDQVIDFIARQLPPGHDARVMGCQNIKGTGLDFVYRWLSIDRVRAALSRLRDAPLTRAHTLAWLGSYDDFGLIDAREALDTLRELEQREEPEWTAHAHLLSALITRLADLERVKAARLQSSSKVGLGARVLGRVEQLVDHLDAVRRGNLAGRVMNDLYAARVGHGRAALLLREVTARQKGGWLAKDLAAWVGGRRPQDPAASAEAPADGDGSAGKPDARPRGAAPRADVAAGGARLDGP